jgi:hypothetical protein
MTSHQFKKIRRSISMRRGDSWSVYKTSDKLKIDKRFLFHLNTDNRRDWHVDKSS